MTRLGAALAVLAVSASAVSAGPAGLEAARVSAARLESARGNSPEAAYGAGLEAQFDLVGQKASDGIAAVFAPAVGTKTAPAVTTAATKHPLSAPVPRGALSGYGRGISDQLEDSGVFNETLRWAGGGLLAGMFIGGIAGGAPGALAGAGIGALGGLVLGFLVAIGRRYVKDRLSRG